MDEEEKAKIDKEEKNIKNEEESKYIKEKEIEEENTKLKEEETNKEIKDYIEENIEEETEKKNEDKIKENMEEKEEKYVERKKEEEENKIIEEEEENKIIEEKEKYEEAKKEEEENKIIEEEKIIYNNETNKIEDRIKENDEEEIKNELENEEEEIKDNSLINGTKPIEEEEKTNEKEDDKNNSSDSGEEKQNNVILNEKLFNIFNYTYLPHKFKYKNPFDYYLFPIIVIISLIIFEIFLHITKNNLLFYIMDILILSAAFKIDLILVFVFSLWTGYEPFFYLTSIIFMIHMYITTSFIIFNFCTTKSNINLKNNNKLAWIISLFSCIFFDYKCLEIFTRTKVKMIYSTINDSNNKIKNENTIIKKKTTINKENINKNEIHSNNSNKKIEKKINESSFENIYNSTSNNIMNTNDHHLNLNNNANNTTEIIKIDKYFLTQERCINKIIIIIDLIFVYLFFILVCIYIIIIYKTYSFLWFACIYGVFFSILHILYFIRFINIPQYYNKKLENVNINKTITINENNVINSKTVSSKINEYNSNRSPDKKIYSNESILERNITSSLKKINDIEKGIKEAPSEEEETHNNKNIYNKELNYNPNNINLGGETDNDEDIISNPYREDILMNEKIDLDDQFQKDKGNLLSKILGKNTKNIENNTILYNKENKMKIPQIPLKNKIKDNDIDENRRLSSYRSFGSDEFRINSIESFNPINYPGIQINKEIEENNYYLKENIGNKNNVKNIEENKSKYNIKQNDFDNNDDEDDNSSVIQNPFRDDL